MMGYYTGRHLPVYDFLARNFCVCDAWHSSIPGDTMPNRLYSIAGREAEPIGAGLGNLLRWLPDSLKAEFAKAPVFDVEAFTRQLRDDDWRWYSHDPATLAPSTGGTATSRISTGTTSHGSTRRSASACGSASCRSSSTTASSTMPPPASCARCRGSTRTL